MEYLVILLCIFMSYFIGSIPFGLIIPRIFSDIDIRSSGSGNPGATNVLRVAGKTLGFFTLFCDILKTVLVVLFVKMFTEYSYLVIVCGFMVIIGHVFPVWLDFKGGKGVASFVATLFVINYVLGCLFSVLWLLSFAIFRLPSLSSLIASMFVPVFAFYMDFNYIEMMFFIAMSLIIILRHKDNIIRILKREEKVIVSSGNA